MPIQLLLDWSKALVAIVCSLLLAISFIMCKPIVIGSSDLHANPSQMDRIENRLAIDALPTNTSLNHNPFGVERMKNDATTVKWHNTTASNLTHEISTKGSITNQPLNASNELNLAAISDRDTFQLHKSLASTQMNATIGQRANTTQAAISLNAQNATQYAGKKRTIESSSKSPVKRTTHQSTITTKAVFLDYLNTFNGSNSQHIDNHKTNISADDEEILTRTERSVQLGKRKKLHNDSNTDRIERSANFSLTKATKRIQLLIKGRFLQMLPDGMVNGTQDDTSEYTILQRNTVDVGQIRLIGIATCLYLCMDTCGNLYSSREFTNDCIFNERLEDNYNYYTSTHHSTALRTYYMALSRLGVPRKTHLPSNKPLGKLSTYARAFTLPVPEHRCDAIIGKRFGFNHVKHSMKHLCESGKQLIELTTKQLVYPECNNATSNINRNLSKKQPNHHHRHASQRPAPLTDRSNKKSGGATTKGGNCNTDQCLKKKKPSNGNRNGAGNKSKKKKINAKTVKTRHTKRVPVTTTTTTTESAILYSSTADAADIYEDELDYSSMQLASNGQPAFISDEEYESDK